VIVIDHCHDILNKKKILNKFKIK